MHKCSILGCKWHFVTEEKAKLHSATSWHCIRCGYSDDRELTIENIATPCLDCASKSKKCIRVDFRKKTYVVSGRLSVKEGDRWIHYE
jgi:NMD protein affecting ribosome stability and mRNA decay